MQAQNQFLFQLLHHYHQKHDFDLNSVPPNADLSRLESTIARGKRSIASYLRTGYYRLHINLDVVGDSLSITLREITPNGSSTFVDRYISFVDHDENVADINDCPTDRLVIAHFSKKFKEHRFYSQLDTICRNGFEWYGVNFHLLGSKDMQDYCYFIKEAASSRIPTAGALLLQLFPGICDPDFRGIAKTGSRIGLLVSGALNGLVTRVDKISIHVLSDVVATGFINESHSKDFCLTDGCGFVSPDVARLLPSRVSQGKNQEELNAFRSKFSQSISVYFQVRIFCPIGIVKGVLLVNPNLPPNTVIVRPSMIKTYHCDKSQIPVYPSIGDLPVRSSTIQRSQMIGTLDHTIFIDIVSSGQEAHISNSTNLLCSENTCYSHSHCVSVSVWMICILLQLGAPHSFVRDEARRLCDNYALARNDFFRYLECSNFNPTCVDNLFFDVFTTTVSSWNDDHSILPELQDVDCAGVESRAVNWLSEAFLTNMDKNIAYAMLLGSPCESDAFVTCVQHDVAAALSEMALKLQLSIPETAYYYGVCDPLNVLQPGEVFLFNNNLSSASTFNVLVAKFPVLLPENVLICKVVQSVELENYFEKIVQQLDQYGETTEKVSYSLLGNLIIFSNSKDDIRNHPVFTISSDFDGDRYFVCSCSNIVNPILEKRQTSTEGVRGSTQRQLQPELICSNQFSNEFDAEINSFLKSRDVCVQTANITKSANVLLANAPIIATKSISFQFDYDFSPTKKVLCKSDESERIANNLYKLNYEAVINSLSSRMLISSSYYGLITIADRSNFLDKANLEKYSRLYKTALEFRKHHSLDDLYDKLTLDSHLAGYELCDSAFGASAVDVSVRNDQNTLELPHFLSRDSSIAFKNGRRYFISQSIVGQLFDEVSTFVSQIDSPSTNGTQIQLDLDFRHPCSNDFIQFCVKFVTRFLCDYNNIYSMKHIMNTTFDRLHFSLFQSYQKALKIALLKYSRILYLKEFSQVNLGMTDFEKEISIYLDVSFGVASALYEVCYSMARDNYNNNQHGNKSSTSPSSLPLGGAIKYLRLPWYFLGDVLLKLKKERIKAHSAPIEDRLFDIRVDTVGHTSIDEKSWKRVVGATELSSINTRDPKSSNSEKITKYFSVKGSSLNVPRVTSIAINPHDIKFPIDESDIMFISVHEIVKLLLETCT